MARTKKKAGQKPAAMKKKKIGKKCAVRKHPPKNDLHRRIPGRRFPSLKGLKTKEAAARIGAELEAAGHASVLVGEACACVYFGTKKMPASLELAVDNYSVDTVGAAMERLGFSAVSEHSFSSERFPVEVILTPMPISVGDDIVENYRIVKTAKGPLKMLTPTDCVRHRLAVFYRFGERAALAGAVKVTRRNPVDMNLLRRWSEWEWAGDKFEEFLIELGR